MGMEIGMNTGIVGTVAASIGSTKAEKPVWNPNKVYNCLEDQTAGFAQYRAKAAAYYKSNSSGKISVDDLKKEISSLFPEYTMTSSEPRLTKGKNYLYIDESQIRKMAEDPDYRAKVYGWMDGELQGMKGITSKYSDGKNVTWHLTGTVFSLSGKNKKNAEGIPYQGSCTGDLPPSSMNSHPVVRSQSFLTDYNKPIKNTRKKAKSAVTVLEEKRIKELERKQKEKRLAEKREQEEEFEERLEQKRFENRFDVRT